MKIKEIKFERNYLGYVYRREIVDDSEFGGDGNLEVISCYSDYDGKYIGSPQMARNLCKKMGISQVQGISSASAICSIGLHEKEKKWYGWSHRAICGFGVGDKIFEEEYGDNETLFVNHGNKDITTMDEAKQAAINFARSVA